MKKINILLITVSTLIWLGCTDSKNLGNGYFLDKVTPTIHTIQYRPLSIWLIRGVIKINNVSEDYFCGYLSTKYFKEDSLIGLEGEYDKEGYFIIWKKELDKNNYNEQIMIISGLSKLDLLNYSKNNNGIFNNCI